jgi:hypothetical protein
VLRGGQASRPLFNAELGALALTNEKPGSGLTVLYALKDTHLTMSNITRLIWLPLPEIFAAGC